MEATGSLLDTVLAAGIALPHLCKDDNLPVIGACRTCLVEADGRIVAACSTPAAGVQECATDSERAVRIRRGVLELTAAMQSGPAGAAGAAFGGEPGSLRKPRPAAGPIRASERHARRPFESVLLVPRRCLHPLRTVCHGLPGAATHRSHRYRRARPYRAGHAGCGCELSRIDLHQLRFVCGRLPNVRAQTKGVMR
ncbi:MAG: 2Fe-2S iron-sulfur cluster-binding protein [Dehalococcoidia bacterium]|nr:2Fe-2S iron-sulfur cluster-binding protein [Dehalococcoidia bacterium]